MPDTPLNRIGQQVVGTPGTGIAVLGVASDSYAALGAAQNGETFSVLWLDTGNAWEVSTGCTYTDAAGTLSRGTLESSSTGSRLSLTSAAVMRVVTPASELAALQAAASAIDGLATVATSGAYSDLSGSPTLGTAAAAASTDFATAAQGTKADSAVQPTIADAKGDLIVATAADTLARLPVGADGQVLTADSAEASGVKWVAGSGGGSGTKTLDVHTPMTSQPPATAFATLDTRNSIAVLDFDAAADESTTWVGVIPEAANLASGLSVRIVWAATSATSGNCRWRVALEDLIGSDIDADSFDTAAEGTGAANATSGIPTVTAITITTIDSLVAGDAYRLRVTRVGTDATNDTMAGDAELIAVEVQQVA